ncbi:hypothetical protein F444_16205 [Phytophthora nicotianae P1976]|uniref:NAD(P)-binding protein n=1 Tax=Phytophthora nicotianae P1976 TaxID=1317066 RepID=A0A080ZJA5_PHYNI|nr:hypothetical protein F444_16205 [Phytophthora nicotianae P1976]
MSRLVGTSSARHVPTVTRGKHLTLFWDSEYKMEALTQPFSYLYIAQLKLLAPFKIVVIDTSDRTSILEATRQLEGQAIDMLINNAGIGIPSNLETRTKDVLINQFEVNAAGLSVVTRPLLPNLQLSSKTNGGASAVQLSSNLGSIGSYTSRLHLCVKAALIMVTRSLAFDLQPSGIVIVLVHSGYMDTDMTQGKTTLKPEDSVMVMASIAKP